MRSFKREKKREGGNEEGYAPNKKKTKTQKGEKREEKSLEVNQNGGRLKKTRRRPIGAFREKRKIDNDRGRKKEIN